MRNLWCSVLVRGVATVDQNKLISLISSYTAHVLQSCSMRVIRSRGGLMLIFHWWSVYLRFVFTIAIEIIIFGCDRILRAPVYFVSWGDCSYVASHSRCLEWGWVTYPTFHEMLKCLGIHVMNNLKQDKRTARSMQFTLITAKLASA